jgi:ABC-2 type transport system permease protein
LRNGIKLLIAKEIKDLLRDPKILVGMILFPALILPLLGGAMSVTTSSTVEKASGNLTVYMVDNDGGTQAIALRNYLNASNVEVKLETGDPFNVSKLLDGGEVLIYVPQGFSQNVTADQKGTLTLYVNFKDFSLVEFILSGRVDSLLNAYGQNITNSKIAAGMPNTDPSAILEPLSVRYESIIKGNAQPVSPAYLQNTVRIQGIMSPLVIMFVLIIAMQIAATSMAIEKEAKTLETLLTIPVSRLSILFSKLAGSVTIALIATVVQIFSITYYISALTGGLTSATGGSDLTSLGIAPTIEGYAVLGLTLFGALISALAIAITLGTLAQDVRGAESLIGVVMVPVFLPTIILMLGDINALPIGVQIALYLIPFTYPALASQALFTGNFGPIFVGLAYMAVFTFATLFIAAKVFSTERIMTSRLTFNLRKHKNVEPVTNK